MDDLKKIYAGPLTELGPHPLELVPGERALGEVITELAAKQQGVRRGCHVL